MQMMRAEAVGQGGPSERVAAGRKGGHQGRQAAGDTHQQEAVVDVHMSDEIGELAAALAKVQGALPTIAKSKTAEIPMKKGGKFSYSYADLAAIWSTARRHLSEHGLALVQPTRPGEKGEMYLQCILLHASGQYIGGEMLLPLAEDIKDVGSSFTYLRRYLLAALLGVVAEDEDTDASGRDGRNSYWHGPPPPQRVAPRQRTDSMPPPRGEQSRRPEPPASQPEPPPPAREPSTPTDRAPEPPPVQQGPAGAPTAADVIESMQDVKAANGGEHPDWALAIYAKMIPGGKVTARWIKSMPTEALAELLEAVRAGAAS